MLHLTERDRMVESLESLVQMMESKDWVPLAMDGMMLEITKRKIAFLRNNAGPAKPTTPTNVNT